ncbi:MAG TPA: secretin N-terminal domain-containing protein [Candidatus Acidoferrum sp.]|nr:secretin N-terminal domain-containing protein [Candidatus Acidoferrum sp.]
MKQKLCILALVGLVAWSLAAFAQTTPPAGETPAATASVTATNDVAQPTTAAEAAAPATNAPAADAAAANAPATPPAGDAAAQPAAAATPAPSATDANAAAASVTDTNAPVGGVIPLIVMDDVPLTDAIKNLARQAGLNYILDPKVSFGQVGADGRPAPQPTVSIRWENVTAAQALNALLGTYNLQLVEDPKSKIARVAVKDPAAPDPLVTKIIQLKFSSPSNIVGAIQSTLTDKRSKVVPDTRTSQLVVLATDKELVEVDELVARLDTQTKQVLIEGRLLETSYNPSTAKGVDWSGTLANQHVSIGNNALPGTAPTPATTIATANGPVTTPASPGTIGGILSAPGILGSLSKGSFFQPAMAFLNADGVSAVISFLNQYSETKVISTPRTVTLDNEPAVIEVGTMFPIVNTTAGTANTTGGSQITYSNLTVRLDVTPRISANDFVHLSVKPSVLRLGPLVKSTVGGVNNAVNSFLKRQMETSVMIPSGDTLVMGGLISDETDQANVKVPLLGDIPGLGLLFRYDTKNRSKSNLIVFLTPTIVKDEDFQPTKTDYLKTPVPTSDYLEGDWSSWNSGKPRDWSKPDPSPKDSDISAKFSSIDTSSN